MSKQFFTKDHEWLKIDVIEGIEGNDDVNFVTIGITDFAQQQLGDVVFVELPDVGSELNAGEDVAVIESVKAASALNIPISGTVTAVNNAIVEDPELVNREPETGAWFLKIQLATALDITKLMDLPAYEQFLGEH